MSQHMETSFIAEETSITNDTANSYRALWKLYTDSVAEREPQLIIPKQISEVMGGDALEDVAKRFRKSLLCEADVRMQYDTDLNAIRIGPSEYLPDYTREEYMMTITYSPDLELSCASRLLDAPSKNINMATEIDKDLPAEKFPKKSGIAKPSNSWILFRQDQHTRVAAENPGMVNCQISKVISERWKGLTTEEKAYWKAVSESKKAELLRKHPNYKCAPRKVVRRHRNSKQVSLPAGPKASEQVEKVEAGPAASATLSGNATPLGFFPVVSQLRE